MVRNVTLAVALCVAAGCTAQAAAAANPPSSALVSGEHHLNIAGVRLWYRVAGRSQGTPLIFLHGGPGQGSQVFQAVGGPELERTQRLVYLDQRGSGRSDRPKAASNYSIDIMVEDIEHLRRHLGVPKISLLGHSFGTHLALEYAARYPQHTAGVVLAAAASDLRRSLDLQCQKLSVEDPDAYARAVSGLPAGAFPRCNTMRAYSGQAAKAFAHRNLFPDLRMPEGSKNSTLPPAWPALAKWQAHCFKRGTCNTVSGTRTRSSLRFL
jgi:proline iminopeptidase